MKPIAMALGAALVLVAGCGGGDDAPTVVGPVVVAAHADGRLAVSGGRAVVAWAEQTADGGSRVVVAERTAPGRWTADTVATSPFRPGLALTPAVTNGGNAVAWTVRDRAKSVSQVVVQGDGGWTAPVSIPPAGHEQMVGLSAAMTGRGDMLVGWTGGRWRADATGGSLTLAARTAAGRWSLRTVARLRDDPVDSAPHLAAGASRGVAVWTATSDQADGLPGGRLTWAPWSAARGWAAPRALAVAEPATGAVDVAAAADGRALVAWRGIVVHGTRRTTVLRMAWIAPDGAVRRLPDVPLGLPEVSTTPVVRVFSDGDAMVLTEMWTDASEPSRMVLLRVGPRGVVRRDVVAQRAAVRSSGRLMSVGFSVAATVDDAGRATVVWQDDTPMTTTGRAAGTQRLIARTFPAEGDPGPPVTVHSGAYPATAIAAPAVGDLPDGTRIVTWSEAGTRGRFDRTLAAELP